MDRCETSGNRSGPRAKLGVRGRANEVVVGFQPFTGSQAGGGGANRVLWGPQLNQIDAIHHMRIARSHLLAMVKRRDNIRQIVRRHRGFNLRVIVARWCAARIKIAAISTPGSYLSKTRRCSMWLVFSWSLRRYQTCLWPWERIFRVHFATMSFLRYDRYE